MDFAGRETVVAGEDPGEFEFYRERMLEELDPVGEVESALAERIVSLSWRLKRAERLQAVAFDSLYAKQKHNLCEKFDKEPGRRRRFDPRPGHRAGLRQQPGAGSAADVRAAGSSTASTGPWRNSRGTDCSRRWGRGRMWELRRALASEDAAPSKDEAVRAQREAVLRTEATCEEPPGGERWGTSDDGRGRSRGSRAGRPWYETLHASPFTLHGAACKTKPISSSADHGQVPANTELTADSPQTELDETKPIPEAEVSSSKFQASSGMALLQTPHFKRPTRVHNKLVANASHVIASGAKQSLTPRVEIASSACSLLAMTSFRFLRPATFLPCTRRPSGRIDLHPAGGRL